MCFSFYAMMWGAASKKFLCGLRVPYWMKVTTEIALEFATAARAQIFLQSFLPEFDDMPMKRSSWQIHPVGPEDTRILVTIQADDVTAFRATINSLVQFAGIVERAFDLVAEGN